MTNFTGTRRATSVTLTFLVTVCVSACGSSAPTLSNTRVERAIVESILREHGLHTTVACPSTIPRKAGHVFTCMAELDVGTYPVKVTETNGTGHVRYESQQPLVVLNIANVQSAIATSIARQRRLSATVTCPAEVLQQAGIVFTCTSILKGKSKRYPFTVTEVDGKGHVRYVGE